MSIEEAIQQKQFEHEWQKATINIMYTSNWVTQIIKENLKNHDVTLQQYNVLRILKGQYPNPVTTSVVRERMLDKMSDASRIVERLHKKGWVLRQQCPSDRRLVDIVITEAGLELLKTIDLDREQIDFILKNLTEAEARTLNALLDKIRLCNTREDACPSLPLTETVTDRS